MISTRDPALAIPRRKGVWQKDDTQFYIDWWQSYRSKINLWIRNSVELWM